MPVTIQWYSNPIVCLDTTFNLSDAWQPDGRTTQEFVGADQLEFSVRFSWYGPNGGWVSFDVWVDTQELVDETPKWVVSGNRNLYETDFPMNATQFRWHTFRLPITNRLFQFRIRTAGRTLRNGDHRATFGPFRLYVDYFGDFSLPYIPISILYCPPSQDMYNASTLNRIHGTVISFGMREAVGTRSESSETIRGGLRLSYGGATSDTGAGLQESAEWTSSATGSSELSTALENMLTVQYEWGSTPIADNQKVIGRRLWGPLGDIYMLLKNPWFSLHGDEQGDLLLGPSTRTRERTEIMIVPAHSLLRPGNDRNATIIPEAIRRALRTSPIVVSTEL